MNVFNGWFTDTVSVYRVSDVTQGFISRQERTLQGKYDCRVYNSQKGAPSMSQREAKLRSDDKLAVRLGTDIQSGDELIVVRGGNLGYTDEQRYFAGDIMPYYEPVGGAFNGLSHIEVGLLQEEIVGGGAIPTPAPDPEPEEPNEDGVIP